MNRKKPNNIIYNCKEKSDEQDKNKIKINNNYIKNSYKKIGHKPFFVKNQKNNDKNKESIDNDKTLDEDNNNNYINDINKTPKKRKKSENSGVKREKEEDLMTSFERKPSELKSPETISESSFTSSYDKDEIQDKKENNELIYFDKNDEKINEIISSNKKDSEQNNVEINTKTTISTTKEKNDNNEINNKKSNLRITVNKTPKENLKINKEKIPYIPVNHRKKSEDINNIVEKNNKKDRLLLTNVKTVKQKKYFIQTEEPKRKYKKKYINVNFTQKKNSSINKSKMNDINDININNKIKGRNKLDEENKKKLNIRDMLQPYEKNAILLTKTKNNKLDSGDKYLNSINENEENNKKISTLSRNISFHNNKKIIYAPKKLISSVNLKSPQKSENLENKNDIIKKNFTKININKNKNDTLSNNSNNINNNNETLFGNYLKNVNNFLNDLNNINIYQTNNYDTVINSPLKNAKNLQLINLNFLGENKILTPHNINIMNQNNYNPLVNSFSVNFEDLIILHKYLQEMLLSLSKNKPIYNESFEYWNYFYNSSLIIQFEKIFADKNDSTEVKTSINYSLMSIMLCYDYSLEVQIFKKVIISLSDSLKMNYKNLILICEYILNKISKESATNIWVLKLASIVNESNINSFNDYTSQILEGYNLSWKEKISYNTNIILQNLRYLLKNFKSAKNAILTSFFKKIREKTYEEINTFFRENILRVSNLNGSILGSIFLLKNRNFRPVPSPYVRTKNNKEFSLVLDLDETLIHFKPQNNGEESGVLRVRPGIYDFLDEVGKYYELIVFTTATHDYADILIDEVEEDKIYFEHRFYREHAIIINNDFVKDLSRIGRPLDKIIIVDNMPQNFRLQKENGIIIKAYWGEDNNDNALYELKNILVKIAKEGGDIRKGLIKYKNDIIKKVTSYSSSNI